MFILQLLTGPLRNLRSATDVVKELRFFLKHIDRKSNEIIFMKCIDRKCEFCIQHPIKCTDTWNYLKERSFFWSNPLPSRDNPGHYRTFIEMSSLDTNALPKGLQISNEKCI